MADIADFGVDQAQHGSRAGQILSVLGALIGGASGRPLGSGMMALGNMMNQRDYDAWEMTNRQKNELPMFQKHLNLTPDEVKYLGQLSRPQYDAAKGTLLTRMFQQQKQGIPRLFQDSHGQLSWISPGQQIPTGETPYEKPPKPPTPRVPMVAGAEADAAQMVGAPLDRSKWTPAQTKAVSELTSKIMLSRQKVPTTPETLIMGPGPGGITEAADVGRPPGGGAPIVSPPVALPFTPGGKGSTTTGASIKDINTALDQAEQTIPLLGESPGAAAALGGAIRYGKSLSGFPAEAKFQGIAASLSDMIPKALAGRSSQSAIDNAMKYMVPSLHDTQASARAKLKSLRQLFIQAGALPNSVMPPQPTFGYTKTQHRGKDWRVLDSSGRWRQFDWASGQWQ